MVWIVALRIENREMSEHIKRGSYKGMQGSRKRGIKRGAGLKQANKQGGISH